MSNIPKKLQPFNQPGKNHTYNVTGVDYENEKAVSGRGRKRKFESDNNEGQHQQQHRIAPASASASASAATVDVIEILDDDDDDDDDENLNVKPAAKPWKKRRDRGPVAAYSVSEEIEILDDDDDDDDDNLDRKPASKPSVALSDNDDEVQVLDQSDMDNRKAPPAATTAAAAGGRKKAPPAAAIQVEENPENAAFLSVLEIVPDVDESFLKKKLREQAYRTDVVVAILLESDYPKQTKPISIDVPARANNINSSKSAAVVVRGRKSIAPKYDYSSPTSFEPSDDYENQVIKLLQYDFCFIKKNNVRTLLSQNHGRYTMTRNYIHDTIVGKNSPNGSDGGKGVAAAVGSDAAGKAKKEENQHYQILKAVLIRGRISEEVKLRIGSVIQCMQKPRKKIGVCCPALSDPILQDEHHHYDKKFKEWREKIQHRLRREAVRKFSVEDGSTVECGICFDDVAKEECVPCREKGHLFCMDCILQYVESQVFGSGNLGIDRKTKKPALEIKCCDGGGCNSGFRDEHLQKALPKKLWEKYSELQTTAQIQRAGLLGNVSTCPKCGYQAELAETQMVFECPVQDCQFSSCKKCGLESHIPLRCEEVVKQNRQDNGRLKIEEALSEAKMRVCPSCKKKFIKSDGCNKMTCACGMKLCYVCNTPLAKGNPYVHFCQTPHCDHSSCGKCKLYTNDEEDDEQAMRDAGLAAKKEYEEDLQKEGGGDITAEVQLDVDQIMHDPSQPRRQRGQQPQQPRGLRVAERMAADVQQRAREAVAHAQQRQGYRERGVAAAQRDMDRLVQRTHQRAQAQLAQAQQRSQARQQAQQARQRTQVEAQANLDAARAARRR